MNNKPAVSIGSLAIWGANILLTAALALGLSLPGGIVSYALAYVILFALPGWLILWVLRLRLNPIAMFSIGVVVGTGALYLPVLLASIVGVRFAFEVVLLIHAVWQSALLAFEVGRRAVIPTAIYKRRWLPLVFAAITVVVLGLVVGAFAHFKLHDSIYLGGSDRVAYTNVINWAYEHPTVPQPRLVTEDPRLSRSVWTYTQALVARVAGLKPYQLVETHAAGLLPVLVMLALFTLVYELTRCVEVSMLALLFTLAGFLIEAAQVGFYDEALLFLFNDRLFDRLIEDKIFCTYIFVPAVIAFTLRLLERRERIRSPLWAALGLALLAIAVTHLVPFFIYVVMIGAYLLVGWLFQPSLKHLFIILGAATAAMLIMLLVPEGRRILSETLPAALDWASAPQNYGGAWHLRVGMNGAYILHPAHVSAPFYMVGIGLGLLMALRARHDRTAHYLFAATTVPLLLVFTPYLASTLGNLIDPHTLERLLWLLPLGPSMAYAGWLLVERVPRVMRSASALALLALAVLVVWSGYQARAPQVFDVSQRAAWPERTTAEIESLAEMMAPRVSLEEPVLAPVEVSTYLFATVSDAVVYSFRQRFMALDGMYRNPWWGLDAIGIMQAYEPVYFVVENDSPPHTFARLQPAHYTEIDRNARYTVYRTFGEWEATLTDRAYSLIAQRENTFVRFLAERPADDAITWDQVAGLFLQALRDNPDDHRARYGLAYVYTQMGDWTEAEALYREVLAVFPTDGNVRAGLAAALWAQDQEVAAIDLLMETLDAPAALRALLGAPYLGVLSDTQLEQALDVWEAQPDFIAGPHPARSLADLVIAERGDRASARRVLEHIALPYRSPEDRRLLGTLYLLDGDVDSALTAYDGTPLYHLTRGHVAMLSGDFAAARDAYEAAAHAEDAPPAAWIFVGRAHEALGAVQDAEAAYQRAADYEGLPGAWGWVELYRFYRAQGRNADTAYRRAVDAFAIADVSPFPPDAPPSVVSPLDALADCALPGSFTLQESHVQVRTAADAVPLDVTWLSNSLDAGGLWWQFKVIQDGEVVGDASQAAVAPAWAAARWTFTTPVEPHGSLPPAEVEVVVTSPGSEKPPKICAVGQVMLGEVAPPTEQPAERLDITFGEQIRLYGYTLDADQMQLKMFWEALAPPDARWDVFVHVWDEAGELAAQADAPPGPYPTDLWEAGARATSVHVLELPPGRYGVQVGLYDHTRRLPVDGTSDDMVSLLDLEISAE